MKPENELALIVAYYLSRLDKAGYIALGYKNFNEAVADIGAILGVKHNTVKNMRDEFDPYHQNNRIGWLRELRGSRLKVLKTFQLTDDSTLLQIVKEILENKQFSQTEEYRDVHALLNEPEKHDLGAKKPFILRGTTGKAAEKYYKEYFKKNSLPVKGKLADCRDLGCGYDFEIQTPNGSHFIEVKGLALDDGGILFTDKEWQTALRYKDRYYVVIIRNISNNPEVTIIQNPSSKLQPKRNLYTTVQVSWSLSKNRLNDVGLASL